MTRKYFIVLLIFLIYLLQINAENPQTKHKRQNAHIPTARIVTEKPTQRDVQSKFSIDESHPPIDWTLVFGKFVLDLM